MATYQLSALSDGQAISFSPSGDVLNFDQSAIAAADIRVTASGSNTRIEVVSGAFAGKDVLLLNVSPLQLTGVNITFANGSRLVVGDNSTALNDNAGNQLAGSAGRDLLMGLGGNDSLVGEGADVLDGGAGFDTASFTGMVSGIVVDFSTGAVSTGALLVSVERVLGSGFGDRMNGDGGGQNLTGQGGDDSLWGAGGVDTLWGGAGADRFEFREAGSANADIVGDFASGTDRIVLDGTVLAGLGPQAASLPVTRASGRRPGRAADTTPTTASSTTPLRGSFSMTPTAAAPGRGSSSPRCKAARRSPPPISRSKAARPRAGR